MNSGAWLHSPAPTVGPCDRTRALSRGLKLTVAPAQILTDDWCASCRRQAAHGARERSRCTADHCCRSDCSSTCSSSRRDRRSTCCRRGGDSRSLDLPPPRWRPPLDLPQPRWRPPLDLPLPLWRPPLGPPPPRSRRLLDLLPPLLDPPPQQLLVTGRKGRRVRCAARHVPRQPREADIGGPATALEEMRARAAAVRPPARPHLLCICSAFGTGSLDSCCSIGSHRSHLRRRRHGFHPVPVVPTRVARFLGSNRGWVSSSSA